MDTIRCVVCGEDKPKEEFHRNTRSKTGSTFYCKLCRLIWYAGYKEHMKASRARINLVKKELRKKRSGVKNG